MKIGMIIPFGRTDKFGYQYDDFTKTILKANVQCADHIIAVGTSRFIKKELFEEFDKIELFSNENTWFNLVNGKEVFSMKRASDAINMALQELKDREYDIAIHVHVNQYIPESSCINLKKEFLKIIKKNLPFAWLYKSYQVGNLLFNSDRRLPWILNLRDSPDWNYDADSIINEITKAQIKIQTGNYKNFNSYAIRDVFGEFTLQDAKEKYEFTVKESRILNKTYDPNNLENLQFQSDVWLSYMKKKINQKKKSKLSMDPVGKKILDMRKIDFISNMLE